MSATNRPFALIRRGSIGERDGFAFSLHDGQERAGRSRAGLWRVANRTARDLLLDQQARLDGPAGLEGRVVALPDHTISILGPKVDAIELLDDVLHLVGDESRDLRRHPEVDLRTGQGAGVESEGGAGIGCRCRPRLVLGKDTDPERLAPPRSG